MALALSMLFGFSALNVNQVVAPHDIPKQSTADGGNLAPPYPKNLHRNLDVVYIHIHTLGKLANWKCKVVQGFLHPPYGGFPRLGVPYWGSP